MTTLSEHPRVTFPPVSRTPIPKLGVVGPGECVRHKLQPILQDEANPFDDIAVCGLEPQSQVKGMPHQYFQVLPHNQLPLDALDAQGFLENTLWIVSTPSDTHVPYAIQLARFGRVALEKPLAATGAQARLLLPFTEGAELYCLNHKVFNAAVLTFVDRCRQDPTLLQRVGHIEGTFYEEAGISPGRQQEDTLADVQWHLISVGLIAPFKATGTYFEIMIEHTHVATHKPDPHGRYATPTVWTASRVQGRLLGEWQDVTFDLRQVKGAPATKKGVRLFDGAGNLLHEIDLSESGWHAHARMLQALMRPVVDMRVDLADAIRIMELIDLCKQMASEEPAYAFGALPGFLA